ncbi:MAG: hypothetical protein KKH28_00165 [Elusimicrobia bacterium]|nr:hypothetical protein [Elusimicrobiota bacterium]
MRQQCDEKNPYCVELMGRLSKTETKVSNFRISDRTSLSQDYEAVVFYDSDGDNFGLFVVDKKTAAHYMTLAILPSRRGHDYTYKITAAEEDSIDLEGSGDTYGDQGVKLRYFFDLKTKTLKADFPYNDISLDKMVRYGGEFFFSGNIDYSSAIIFRLKSASPENGKYEYEAITKIEGEKIGPISGIEEKDGELRFISKEKTYIFAKDGKFKAEINPKVLQVKVSPHEMRIPKEGGDDVWSVPSPGYELFAKYRPDKVKGGSLRGALVENLIGPWVRVGSKIWFGIKFYDGEGRTGIGGYGIFDADTMNAEVRYSTETAPWSASAIFVDNDRVCLGLYGQPEGSAYPGGLFCDYLKTKIKKVFRIPQIINSIQESDGKLVVAASDGLYIVQYNRVVGGKFSVNEDGSYRMDFSENAP